MAMPMMNVRIVWMTVAERLVLVLVRVRLGAVPSEVMAVAMMLVMRMDVVVRQGLVPVQMLVVLEEMQHHPGGHQRCGGPEDGIRRFAEQDK